MFNLADADKVMVHHTHDAERPGIIIFCRQHAGVVAVVDIEMALEQISLAIENGVLTLVDSSTTFCLFVPTAKPCHVCGLMLWFNGASYECKNCDNKMELQ